MAVMFFYCTFCLTQIANRIIVSANFYCLTLQKRASPNQQDPSFIIYKYPAYLTTENLYNDCVL
jgi:hypothetical protein